MTTKSQTKLNSAQAWNLIQSHPNGHYVEYETGIFAGDYPKVYPLVFVDGGEKGWAIAGGRHAYGSSVPFRVQTTEELQTILNGIPPCPEGTWDEYILAYTQPHQDPFMSTSPSDEARYTCREKEWFSRFALNRKYTKDYSIPFGEDLSIFIRFYTTRFTASLNMRLSLAPSALITRRPPQNLDQMETIAECCWGQNGSGFRQKYVEAIALVAKIASGDWSDLKPLTQDNRSTSYSPRTGEEHVRFWSADLTNPQAALETLRSNGIFPLPLPAPLPEIER